MKFDWEVAYAVVTEDYISKLKEDKKLFSYPGFRKPYKAFKYDAFSIDRLYEEFSNIETNNLMSIEDFVNKYGFLGLQIEYKKEDYQDIISRYKSIIKKTIDENNVDILRQYHNAESALELINKVILIEKTTDFIKEVKLMCGLLELNSYKKVKVSEIETVQSKINEVADLAYIDYEYTGDMPDFELMEHAAKGLISSIISMKMKNVDRYLALEYDTNKKTYVYIDSWKPKSLLGCMYTMLYIDLAQGRRTEICPVCLKPFVVTDNRDKQTHTLCRGSRNTQNTRKRQEEEARKHIVNKYGKSNISPGCILEAERDYIFSHIGKSTPFNIKRIKEWLNTKEDK